MKAQIESLRLKKAALEGLPSGFHRWVLDTRVDEVSCDLQDYLEILDKHRDETLIEIGWKSFRKGDKIEFCGDEFIVLENYGTNGRVLDPMTDTIIDPFYWEFEGEKCRLIK